jgi:glucose-6-phosphate 1-dehydrogenase
MSSTAYTDLARDNDTPENASPSRPGPADPCVMVIFGASGDLTKRKLVPALINLATGGLLSDRFAIVANSRGEMSEEEFRSKLIADVRDFVPREFDAQLEAWITGHVFYARGSFQDDALYAELGTTLARVDEQFHTDGNVLFYLATPPQAFTVIVQQLGRAGLTTEKDKSWRRVIIEKPFGHDLKSAHALNDEIGRVLKETQIYRIDHYLGKETVQNLMVFRFANGIFEPIWNRRYVDHVQITVAESVGVEGRGGYYEGAGALRDMVQNHLFQVLALTVMEPPISFAADTVRDERVKALRAVHPFQKDHVSVDVVRGQYSAGAIAGQPVPAYRDEKDVNPSSCTETFVALRVKIDNWRWAGVPFYLRTGKRLPKRVSEIAIQFRSAPLTLFRNACGTQPEPNQLIVRIQPDEGISLRFQAKVPGPDITLGDVKMDFKYVDYFGAKPSTGYETLLYDCMTGDSTLFHRADMIEAGWEAVTPILDAWEAERACTIATYPAGAWGPQEADDLLARDGRKWRRP